MNEKLGNYEILCVNKKKGCNWEDLLKYYEEHLRICPKRTEIIKTQVIKGK